MLSNREERYFKELSELIAPSGAENNVAYYLKNEFESLGLEIVTDNIGSIFALKKSKNPNAKKVMISGHMDEIGFYLARILPNGLIKCTPIGAQNIASLQSNRVVAINDEGQEIKGFINSNLNLEGLKATDLEFDFGFTSKDEALKASLNVGSPIVCAGEFEYTFNKQSIIGKALDGRYGLVLGLELLHQLKDIELPFDLYVGGTVQKEINSRGAQTCSYKISPDLAIVLDCLNSETALGNGVLIRVLDNTMIAKKEVLNLQIEACKASNSKYQYFEIKGTTDASNIHKNRDGIVTLTHCVSARGVKTASTLMRVSDYEDARNSLIYLVKNLTNETIEQLKGKTL